ncbi:MAG: hypothetical protein K2N10_07840, partial [Muribaculaceae bacterium]|nr:hypothetical protein [Muribaculaceae bacterium]
MEGKIYQNFFTFAPKCLISNHSQNLSMKLKKLHLLMGALVTSGLGAFAQDTFSMIDASTLDGKYITLTNCNQGIVMFHTGTSMQSRLHPGKLESLWYTTYNADNQTITIQACDGTNRYISWCPDDTNIIWTTVEETDIDNIGEFKVLQKDDQYAFGATRR